MKPLIYLTKKKGKIVVPSGFITDKASIPKIFWSVVGNPSGKYAPAAVIHDWCYFKKLYSRKRCDQIFEEAMKESKVNWLKRKLMYWAVRLFAWAGWNAHRKRNND